MRIPLPLLLLLLLVVSDAIFAPVAYLHTELQPGARFSTFISLAEEISSSFLLKVHVLISLRELAEAEQLGILSL
jgi:hypothetical protein